MVKYHNFLIDLTNIKLVKIDKVYGVYSEEMNIVSGDELHVSVYKPDEFVEFILKHKGEKICIKNN